MKPTRVRVLLRWSAVVVVCGILALAGSPLHAASSVRTDEQLFRDALAAYNDENWLKAALELHAYIERDPEAMQTDAKHAQQVRDALDYALYRIDHEQKKWELKLRQCNERADEIRASCEDQCEDVVLVAAKVQGLTSPSPMPALDQPVTQSERSYPIICRGGGDLAFSYAASSTLSSRPHVEITFEKAARGTGYNGEYILALDAGQCAFIDRSIRATEPDNLVIGYPVLDPDEFAISWTADGDLWLQRPDILRTMRTAQASYHLFQAYNSLDGHFIVSKIGIIVAMLEANSSGSYAIGHEGLNGLTAGARVYTDRNYTYSSVPAFLEGATFIQTANGDKGNSQSEDFLTFQTNRKADVYVAHDDRYASKPAWLSGFTKTSSYLAFYDGSRTIKMTLYRKIFVAGRISLGGNVRAGETGNYGMYTVAILGVD